MKHLFLSLFLLAVPAFADHHEGAGDFETKKKEALEHIDEKIAKLGEHKTCVSGAADKEAMKKCMESHKDWMKSEKKERHERRKAFHEERLKKLKEKEAK